MAHEDDELDLGLTPQSFQRLEEQRIVEAVIGGSAWRRSSHDEHPPIALTDAELLENGGIRLEISQIDLLLEAVVTLNLRTGCTLPADHVGRHRVRDENHMRKPKCQMVRRLKLEVHGGHGPHAAEPSSNDLSVRVVRKRYVRPLPARPRAQVADPVAKRGELRSAGTRARAADHFHIRPSLARELHGLSVVSRRDQHFVPQLVESARDRARRAADAGNSTGLSRSSSQLQQVGQERRTSASVRPRARPREGARFWGGARRSVPGSRRSGRAPGRARYSSPAAG